MDDKIKNPTLEAYKSIHFRAAAIFVTLLEVVLTFADDNFLEALFNRWFPYNENSLFWIAFSKDVVDAAIEILLYGLGYLLIYFLVKWEYCYSWKKKNKSCYLNGLWYHIHYKDTDDGYLRCGTVEIRQNFYDLEIEAKNYNPLGLSRDEDSIHLKVDPKNITYWHHDITSLSEQGDILGAYSSNKLNNASTVTIRGIHEFHVIDHDEKGFPLEIGGFFADTCSVEKVGNIHLYRAKPLSFPMRVRRRLDSIKDTLFGKKEEKNTAPTPVTSVELSLHQAPKNWINALYTLKSQAQTNSEPQ